MSQRKQMVSAFLKMAAMGDVRAAFDKYTAPHFIHHNTYFAGDRQSLMSAMEQAHRTSPNQTIEINKVLEDGDHVATASRVVRKDPSAAEIAVVHIFRFEGDRVAELWDVGMELPTDSPNTHGAF
jgi:predicted SnoaL-like aldol condensation-catalyzing enzyme